MSYDPDGCLLYPGDGGCSPGRPIVFDRRLPLPDGQPLHPARTSHRAEPHLKAEAETMQELADANATPVDGHSINFETFNLRLNLGLDFLCDELCDSGLFI